MARPPSRLRATGGTRLRRLGLTKADAFVRPRRRVSRYFWPFGWPFLAQKACDFAPRNFSARIRRLPLRCTSLASNLLRKLSAPDVHRNGCRLGSPKRFRYAKSPRLFGPKMATQKAKNMVVGRAFGPARPGRLGSPSGCCSEATAGVAA